MAACVCELEFLKPPPAGFVAWGLTGEIGELSDYCCKHCREAVKFMRANQQSTEILCDQKKLQAEAPACGRVRVLSRCAATSWRLL